MNNDVTLSETVEVTKNVTLNLNGKTLTGSIKVSNGAEVTIKNGTLASTGTTDAVTIVGDATLNIEETAVLTADDACCVFVTKDASESAVTVNIAGTLTSASTKDGTKSAVVYANGGCKNVDLNVTAGSITATGGLAAIYWPADGDVTISNANVKGGESAIEYRGTGKLTINSGSFEATVSPYSAEADGNGTTTIGAAVVVAPHSGRASEAVVNGGTFKAANAECYAFWAGVVEGTANATVSAVFNGTATVGKTKVSTEE